LRKRVTEWRIWPAPRQGLTFVQDAGTQEGLNISQGSGVCRYPAVERKKLQKFEWISRQSDVPPAREETVNFAFDA
jgi:hypothetical protein